MQACLQNRADHVFQWCVDGKSLNLRPFHNHVLSEGTPNAMPQDSDDPQEDEMDARGIIGAETDAFAAMMRMISRSEGTVTTR